MRSILLIVSGLLALPVAFSAETKPKKNSQTTSATKAKSKTKTTPQNKVRITSVPTATIIHGNASLPTQACSKWSPSDWDEFIQSNLLDNLAGKPYGFITSDLAEMKRSCSESVEKHGLDRCFERISGYMKQFDFSQGGELSAIMSDEEYYARQPADAMELPPELKSAPNGLPENWREIAKKNGWKWVQFHSDTGNQRRLVMYIPGEKYDRMVVYFAGIGPDDDPAEHDAKPFKGLQMQVIEKQRDGKVPQDPMYYFRSWGFTGPNKTPHVQVSGGRCVSCHVSGPRAIVPNKNSSFPPELGGVESLAEFNNFIVQKKPLNYDLYYDLKNFPEKMDLGSADQCTQCHDGKQRRSLAFSVMRLGIFNSENIHRKVVREGTMPKDPLWERDAGERSQLVDSLDKEYHVKLKQWLTETKCSSLKPPTSDPQIGEKPAEPKDFIR